jgi:hypothetical protein
MARVAEPREAEQHHRPGRRFENGNRSEQATFSPLMPSVK